MSEDPGRSREREISRDRETIRRWADDVDVVPVRDTGAGTESEEVRMVPRSEVGSDHEEVEWEEFADHLDEGDRVVVYHGTEADRPMEVTRQRDVVEGADDEEIENRLMQGETVTSTITETAVVERVVVEEATIESELVDTQMLDQRVADVELLHRDCTNCEFVDDAETDTREYFDVERYLATVGGEPGTAAGPSGGSERAPPDEPRTDFPYHAELEVEEAWSVTREYLEQFVVESRVVDTDVSEADTLSDFDVDVEGLHRSIVEGGIVDVDHPPEEALTHYDVESELAENDRITTTFSRERTVEEEILDRMLLTAEIGDADLLGMETIDAERIESGATAGTDRTDDTTGTTGTDATATDAETDRPEAEQDVTTSSEESVDAHAGTSAGERVSMSNATIGKDVVDASGEKIGIVSDVREDRQLVYVDPHPGIAARVQAALGWGDAGEDDYELSADAIQRITDDHVELKHRDDLDATGGQH